MRVALVLCLFFAACASAPKNATTPEWATEKARLLALVDQPPAQTLELTGLEQAPRRNRLFAEYYRDRIWPLLLEASKLEESLGLLSVLIDRVLYDSPEEHAALEGRMRDATRRLSELKASQGWKDAFARGVTLSRGLRGELPDQLRKSAAVQVLLDPMDVVLERIKKADSESPLRLTLDAAQKSSDEVRRHWYDGELGFEAATLQLEGLQKTGRVGMAQGFVGRARGDLDELARLRTRFAKSQGYPTWARYQVGQEAARYGREYGTVALRRAFSEAVLKRTERAYRFQLKMRLEDQDIRAASLPLLMLRTDPLISAYIAPSRAEESWRKMVLGNGFDPRVLSEIRLDRAPRSDQYRDGATLTAWGRKPYRLTFDVGDFSAVPPAREETSAWLGAEVHLLAGLAQGGPGSVRALFREGGHALEIVHRQSAYASVPARAYSETISKLMEQHVFDDVEHLKAMGVPEPVIAHYRINSERNRQLELRKTAAESLVELDVWDYDYSQARSETFTNRALRLHASKMGSALGVSYGMAQGLDWRMEAFANESLYEGRGGKFSDLAAALASEFVASALSEKLFALTGRRELYGQALFAPTLVQGLLERGFSEPFPRQIEKFAGKPFRP
jgi:hypothetical protein